MKTATHNIYNVRTTELVGTIIMTAAQWAAHLDDCGPNGAIKLSYLRERGIYLDTTEDSDATVYVAA